MSVAKSNFQLRTTFGKDSPGALRPNIRAGDVGTEFWGKLEDDHVAFDPTTAVTKRFIFQKPNGVVLIKDAEVVVTETTLAGTPEYYLRYITEADLHDVAGEYQWGADLEFSNGSHFSTDVRKYRVEPTILSVQPPVPEELRLARSTLNGVPDEARSAELPERVEVLEVGPLPKVHVVTGGRAKF